MVSLHSSRHPKTVGEPISLSRCLLGWPGASPLAQLSWGMIDALGCRHCRALQLKPA